MEQAVHSPSSIQKADNLLTTKNYQKAIDEYRIIQDQTSDPNVTKFINNRILHCKFMLKGILDCRQDGIGIYYNDAEITIKEAMQIIGEIKSEHPGKNFTKNESFGSYYGMSLGRLEELKAKFNDEKNKTEARKVRAAMRKLK